MRPKLLAKNPRGIAKNHHYIVVNNDQVFVGSMHSDFFHRQTGGALICWSNYFWEHKCLIKKKEDIECFMYIYGYLSGLTLPKIYI